jgi:hypothetical protein
MLKDRHKAFKLHRKTYFWALYRKASVRLVKNQKNSLNRCSGMIRMIFGETRENGQPLGKGEERRCLQTSLQTASGLWKHR